MVSQVIITKILQEALHASWNSSCGHPLASSRQKIKFKFLSYHIEFGYEGEGLGARTFRPRMLQSRTFWSQTFRPWKMPWVDVSAFDFKYCIYFEKH